MKILINNFPINSITKIEWSGEYDECSRRLIVEHLDYYKNKLQGFAPSIGDLVTMTTDLGEPVFKGMIYTANRKTNSTTSTFIAFDDAYRLKKNYFIKHYNKLTANFVTRGLLHSIGLNLVEFPPIDMMVTGAYINKSAEAIINDMYYNKLNKRTGMYYSVEATPLGGISVVQQGLPIKGLILEKNIQVEHKNDITNMINQVAVYQTKDSGINFLAKHSNLKDIAKYHISQNIYLVDKDGQDNSIDSIHMMKKEEEIIDVFTKGDYRLKSGKSVFVKDTEGGVEGVFYIKSDSHIWLSNEYTVKLKLEHDLKIPFTKMKTDPPTKKIKGKWFPELKAPNGGDKH